MACCSTHAELLPLSKHNTGHLWSPGAFSQISLCSLRMMWRHLQDESRCFTVLHPAYVCLASAEEGFKVKINRERFAAAGPTTGDVRTSKVNTQKIPNSNKRSPSGKLRNFLHPPQASETYYSYVSLTRWRRGVISLRVLKATTSVCINITHNSRTNCFPPITAVKGRTTAPFGTRSGNNSPSSQCFESFNSRAKTHNKTGAGCGSRTHKTAVKRDQMKLLVMEKQSCQHSLLSGIYLKQKHDEISTTRIQLASERGKKKELVLKALKLLPKVWMTEWQSNSNLWANKGLICFSLVFAVPLVSTRGFKSEPILDKTPC